MMIREAVNPINLISDLDRASAPIRRWGLHPRWMLVLLLSVPLAAMLFWWLGTRFFGSSLTLLEYQQLAVVIAGATVGGYQLYFWVQRNARHVPARCLVLPIDGRIGFRPRWIWSYSILYYAMIGLTVVSVRSPEDAINLLFGGLLVLSAGCLIFYFYPTHVPDSFRSFDITSLSTRYLSFIQSMDSSRNAFPSMHCAIATYVGLVLSAVPAVGPWLGYGFVSVTVVSCLFVKQHVVADTLGGIVLGFAVFHFNEWMSTALA